jgi:hypothetical protein
MARPFDVKTAAELLDAGFLAKWEERRALDPLARTVLRTILDQFVASGGPVSFETVAALLREQDPARLSQAIARLDEKDLILVADEQVTLAYPFSGTPTAFKVVMPDGRERYAICAIDALGIPAMLGKPVTIRSRCHHCGAPLEIPTSPEGPIGNADVIVWVGERDTRKKACASFCLTLNFFSSEAHLQSWRETHHGSPGAAAVLEEAFRVGAKIFGELLREIV